MNIYLFVKNFCILRWKLLNRFRLFQIFVNTSKPDSVPAKADQLKNRVYILHIIYYYFYNFKSKNIGHNKD